MSESTYILAAEAARELRMKPMEFTKKIVGKRLIPFVLIPGNKRIRIKRADLDAFIAKYTIPARKD